MITIGADATCDWQIRAAFVPPRALSVLLINGITYVRPGTDMSVLLNGHPLDNSWTEVDDGARIDVGLARLEIKLEGASQSATRSRGEVYGGAAASWGNGRAAQTSAANDPHYASAHAAFVTPPPAPEGSTASAHVRHPHPRGAMFETQAYDTQTFDSAYRQHETEARSYADLEDSGEFETRPMSDDRARERVREPEYDDQDGVPAVLDDFETKDRSKWWRYALAGAATACAYGGWIVLLDYL